jgi:hypothetical protein
MDELLANVTGKMPCRFGTSRQAHFDAPIWKVNSLQGIFVPLGKCEEMSLD